MASAEVRSGTPGVSEPVPIPPRHQVLKLAERDDISVIPTEPVSAERGASDGDELVEQFIEAYAGWDLADDDDYETEELASSPEVQFVGQVSKRFCYAAIVTRDDGGFDRLICASRNMVLVLNRAERFISETGISPLV